MKNSFLLFGIAVLFFSLTVKAQEKWSVEFRPGLNFPSNDVGNTEAKVGYGFEIVGAYKIMPHLAAYAGWGWNQFKGEDRVSKDDIILNETGYTFGFQFIHPIGTSNFSYVAGAGAIYNHIELENNTGDITADTGHGFGWQVAAGIDYEIAPNLSFRPMLRYRSLSRSLEVANVSTDMKLNYFAFGIGLILEF